MNLRSSGTLHYINAIKGCSVIKIQNVKSRGLVFKNLKDIYEAECARHPHLPVKKESCEDGVLNDTNKYSCLPMAERETCEREHQVDISNCSSHVDGIPCSVDDISFGEMTLKQLKKRCKTKKRKRSEFVCLSPKKEVTEFLQDEDDCDLTTPLSSWNVKLPKRAKSKKKRAKSSANCAPVSIKVEDSPICCSEFQSASFVTEAGCGSSSSDEQVNLLSDMDFTKLHQNSDTTLGDEEIISVAGQYETHVLSKSSYCQLDDDLMPVSFLPPLSGNTEGPRTKETGLHPSVSNVSELQKEAEMTHSPSSKSLLLIDKPLYDNRFVISSQSSLDMQEISCHGTGDQVPDSPLEYGISCTETVHGRELCILEDTASTSSDMFNSSPCCFSMQVIFNKESARLVTNMETDYTLWCTESGGGIKLSVFEVIKSNMHHNLPNSFLRSPFCYYSSPWNCYPCSVSDSDLVAPENDSPVIDDNRSLITDNSHTARNCLEHIINLTCLEDSSYANKEKQLVLPVNTDAEISFSSIAVNQFSNPETDNHHDMVLWHPPERFPSMRKVISPSSQEKLCLAMSSREMYDDIDNSKCKGKLFFGNQIEDSTLSATSDTAGGESYVTDESSGKVTLTKAILGPKKTLKKLKRYKKGSPPKRCSSPKGHIEGMTKEGSRSLPGLCTRRISSEACRESVVEFSQRQMHDIESIALKLMTELKSMKDIVEQKFLNEAYHCTSMRNDTDEVKSAIKGATRVEETTKKRLSMMARDCNRFCKIMSQPQRSTEDIATATENIVHRKKKRISFADEAGGVLCHVKYF